MLPTVLRHADDELFEHVLGPRPTRPSLGAAVVLGSHELPVPSQDGVRGRDSRQLMEPLATKGLGPVCQSAALVVGESESTTPELLPQHAILFP